MWHVAAFEAIAVELDFTSSEQGLRAATAIEANGVRLFNALELVQVGDPETQVEICEHCGFSNCSPGGWVAFRRVGERVVWIPAWDAMEKGDWEETEYRPPAFMRRQGMPIFSSAAWHRLRLLQPALPAHDALPWLDSREAVRLSQWSAPGGLLGAYPLPPRLDHELLVSATEGDLAAEAEVVDACLRSHFEAARPMKLAPADAVTRPIEFWLDLPGTPSWADFARVGNDVRFVFDPDAVLLCEDAADSGAADSAERLQQHGERSRPGGTTRGGVHMLAALKIVGLCLLAAIAYGMLHNQVTVRVCVEYFTIGHPAVFATQSPTLLALGWGVLATWWVGLLLGVPLAFAALRGPRPKRRAGSLLRPILVLLATMGTLALVAGFVGFALARAGLIVLVEPLASQVPADRHARFLADLWAHSTSYLAGFIGGIVLVARVWRSRRSLATASAQDNVASFTEQRAS